MNSLLAQATIAINVRRGPGLESTHLACWCVTEPGDRVSGASDTVVCGRSTLKPLQALASVRAGTLERYRLSPRHLAAACGSHGGDAQATAVVGELLRVWDRTEKDLECGPALPLDPSERHSHLAAGGQPEPILNDCSGKHALAIATCVHAGWPTRGYVTAAHPMQGAIRAVISDIMGIDAATLKPAIDGCGMVTYFVTLSMLTRGFAKLASPAGDEMRSIVSAMNANLDLIGYPGTIDTVLMEAIPGAVAKVGSEGLLAMGLPDGRGFAVKVHDGAMRALAPAVVAALQPGLGIVPTDALRSVGSRVLRNTTGEAVGEITAEPMF